MHESHATVTLEQLQKILFLTRSQLQEVKPDSVRPLPDSSVELEIYQAGSLFTKLVGYVILDADGEIVATVTPGDRKNSYALNVPSDDSESGIISGNQDDDSVYAVATSQARARAIEIMMDRV